MDKVRTAQPADSLSEPIPGQYIVIYRDKWNGQISNEIADLVYQFVSARIAELGIPDSLVKNRYENALRGFTAELTEEQLAALQNDPRVDYIEQDRRFSLTSTGSESYKPSSSITAFAGQTTPWGLSWVGGSNNGTGEVAWILDSGIDLDHPDLNVDESASASFVAGESADDLLGHGTKVAGLLAALDNARGIVGVAAGAEVVSIKVCDQNGLCDASNVADGVDFVALRASLNDIINLSLGGPVSMVMDDAVINAANNGLRFSIAAGNEKQNANNVSPARVEHANVWTVSAFKKDGDFAESFDCNTNFGSNFSGPTNPPIEFTGPGNNLISLDRGGGTSGLICGTSFAAPHIGGLLLALDNNPFQGWFLVSGDPDGDPDPVATREIPAPDVTGSDVNGYAHLDWDAIADASEYEVWYHTTETDPDWSEGFTKVSTRTSTSYEGVDLNSNHAFESGWSNYTASYKVKAIAASPYKNSGFSNQVDFIYWVNDGGGGCQLQCD